MKTRFIVVLCVSILLIPSCNKTSTYDSFAGFVQGTTYSMVFETNGKLNPQKLKQDVESILHDFDMSLSLYADSSIVSKVNRNENITLDDYFKEAFDKSAQITEMTEGAFDITVGPLVKAWGFGPDSQKNFTEAKRDSLIKLVGMDKVKIENGRLLKDDPGINLDFNAIAQGYSVDVVSDFFNSKGIKSFLIEIGGEVRVKGDKKGVLWRIGIDRPEDNNNLPGNDLQAVISLKDRSLATSGNYRKFYVENGIKYSHTIDPRTGYPARNKLLSSTIIAKDCATADGIATACMVMGKEKAIEFLGFHPELDAFLVFSDDSGNYQTWTTENLKRFISQPGN
ncbi:MAG TPA: thiamine biosynthesis protein ApbE [Bacteroidales bacterium]|jgi:FAD:protein FMN transferase|nr:thiamine biosynthesis protein ApbE [Bacteroidales bacterium]HBZ22575.1 thiamine biosynthesis protein ApbE [Bacteroidales bacterium]